MNWHDRDAGDWNRDMHLRETEIQRYGEHMYDNRIQPPTKIHGVLINGVEYKKK
jgi:hypothetical protein